MLCMPLLALVRSVPTKSGRNVTCPPLADKSVRVSTCDIEISVWWVQSSQQVYPAEGEGICALSIPVMIVRTIKILWVFGRLFQSIFNDKLNFIRHVDRSPNSFSYLISKRN